MLTSSHALPAPATASPQPSCKTPLMPCDYLSASCYKMSHHVPSLLGSDHRISPNNLSDLNDNNYDSGHLSAGECHQNSDLDPFAYTDCNDNSESQNQHLQFSNSSNYASLLAQDNKFNDFKYGRNKRKNFKPRCITDDNPAEQPPSEIILNNNQSQSDSNLLPANNSSPDNKVNTANLSDKVMQNSEMFDNSSPNDALLSVLISNLNNSRPVCNNNNNNGKATEQPLDLSNQEQLQQTKQLAELLFLKNIRNIYPQLSDNFQDSLLMQLGSKLNDTDLTATTTSTTTAAAAVADAANPKVFLESTETFSSDLSQHRLTPKQAEFELNCESSPVKSDLIQNLFGDQLKLYHQQQQQLEMTNNCRAMSTPLELINQVRGKFLLNVIRLVKWH